MLDNQELTAHVCKLSLSKFSLSFDHEARWNNRLKTTGGRFFPKDFHLDFNPKLQTHPDFDRIILHELTHYHLYRAKRGYRHKDKDFKQLLSEVNGLRYAPTLQDKTLNHYFCSRCGQKYARQRKINLQKYRCGICRGKLILE